MNQNQDSVAADLPCGACSVACSSVRSPPPLARKKQRILRIEMHPGNALRNLKKKKAPLNFQNKINVHWSFFPVCQNEHSTIKPLPVRAKTQIEMFVVFV